MGATDEGELTLHGAEPKFPGGLRDLGDGIFAWLLPNGVLGESNAGLVVGEGESLLIDTPWDLRLTGEMLAAMAEPTAEAPIRHLVNTHSDGDHWWGNQLVTGAEMIASRATVEQMRDESVGAVTRLLTLGKAMGLASNHSLPMPRKETMSAASRYFGKGIGPFDFTGIELTVPTRTFHESLSLEVGGRAVELIKLGPAHTEGDTIVHVPDADAVYTADLLFAGVTPLMWTGPVANWIAAIDRILELDPKTIVPGHGPPSDQDDLRAMRSYWEFTYGAARDRFDADLTAGDAAREILASAEFKEGPFAGWAAPERLRINVAMIYRELRGKQGRVTTRERIGLMIAMAEFAAELQRA
jgi:glyoxylase-like metal-dependent hydrolase (beta-lactamase superfamily II)